MGSKNSKCRKSKIESDLWEEEHGAFLREMEQCMPMDPVLMEGKNVTPWNLEDSDSDIFKNPNYRSEVNDELCFSTSIAQPFEPRIYMASLNKNVEEGNIGVSDSSKHCGGGDKPLEMSESAASSSELDDSSILNQCRPSSSWIEELDDGVDILEASTSTSDDSPDEGLDMQSPLAGELDYPTTTESEDFDDNDDEMLTPEFENRVDAQVETILNKLTPVGSSWEGKIVTPKNSVNVDSEGESDCSSSSKFWKKHPRARCSGSRIASFMIAPFENNLQKAKSSTVESSGTVKTFNVQNPRNFTSVQRKNSAFRGYARKTSASCNCFREPDRPDSTITNEEQFQSPPSEARYLDEENDGDDCDSTEFNDDSDNDSDIDKYFGNGQKAKAKQSEELFSRSSSSQESSPSENVSSDSSEIEAETQSEPEGNSRISEEGCLIVNAETEELLIDQDLPTQYETSDDEGWESNSSSKIVEMTSAEDDILSSEAVDSPNVELKVEDKNREAVPEGVQPEPDADFENDDNKLQSGFCAKLARLLLNNKRTQS